MNIANTTGRNVLNHEKPSFNRKIQIWIFLRRVIKSFKKMDEICVRRLEKDWSTMIKTVAVSLFSGRHLQFDLQWVKPKNLVSKIHRLVRNFSTKEKFVSLISNYVHSDVFCSLPYPFVSLCSHSPIQVIDPLVYISYTLEFLTA